MAENKHETRNTAIAAALILLVAGVVIYVTPKIVRGLNAYSPLLNFIPGMIVALSFFLVFWLRSKYKK